MGRGRTPSRRSPEASATQAGRTGKPLIWQTTVPGYWTGLDHRGDRLERGHGRTGRPAAHERAAARAVVDDDRHAGGAASRPPPGRPRPGGRGHRRRPVRRRRRGARRAASGVHALAPGQRRWRRRRPAGAATPSRHHRRHVGAGEGQRRRAWPSAGVGRVVAAGRRESTDVLVDGRGRRAWSCVRGRGRRASAPWPRPRPRVTVSSESPARPRVACGVARSARSMAAVVRRGCLEGGVVGRGEGDARRAGRRRRSSRTGGRRGTPGRARAACVEATGGEGLGCDAGGVGVVLAVLVEEAARWAAWRDGRASPVRRASAGSSGAASRPTSAWVAKAVASASLVQAAPRDVEVAAEPAVGALLVEEVVARPRPGREPVGATEGDDGEDWPMVLE